MNRSPSSPGRPAEASAAVEAADRAQRSWAATAPRVRAEILRSCWSTLIDHTDELATLITLEHGKPLAGAKGEIAYAAEFFRWNSEEAVRIDGMIKTAPGGSSKIIVHHPPVGVVVMVTPWNFPAAMITRKVAPALAAGNACVIKPPAETPLTALRVAQLLEEAGVPAGLVNVVPTSTPGEWFDAATEHRATRMVSFTGSTAVGKILLKRCADRVLKVGMELGGNAPLVVFEDADLDLAVEGAMIAKMRHSAEVCTAANRMFVHADVADEFTERMAQAMGAVKVGNGMDEGVTCGPMINEEAIVSIDSLVKRPSRWRICRHRWRSDRRPGFSTHRRCSVTSPWVHRSRRKRSSACRPGHSLHRHRPDDRLGQRHRDGARGVRVLPRCRPCPRRG